MSLYSFDPKRRIAEISNIGVHRLRVRDACNPREQSAQLLGQCRAARQIAQADGAATPKDARELCSGSSFIRKRAEGALADHSVEGGVRERQPFGIADSKTDTLIQSSC